MSANYKKLGDYITQRREKNTAINLPICGVCREGLIPPKQQDADISLYNVFYKNDFIFNPARMELNSITLNTEYDKAICSSLYEIFYINDTSKLLPEFLFVQLKTDNFIRFCEFQGQGSVREYCRFANISEYPVIVPDLKEQEKIVNTYNAITKRIQLKQKINENLEKMAQCLFEKTIEQKEKNAKLKDIAEINSGKRPEEMTQGNFPLVGAGDIMGYISNFNYDGKTLVIGRVGTHGKVQRFSEKCWCSDNTLTIKSKLYEYTYFILKNIDYSLLNRGSTQPLITQTDIRDFDIFYSENDVKDFEKVVSKLMLAYDENNLEIIKLQALKQLVISRISEI